MENSDTFIAKLQELLTDSDNEMGQCCFQEEMIEKVMQEFYNEIACSPLPRPSPPTPTPMPTFSPSYSPSTNDGSCGNSVAQSASKLVMMAGTEAVNSVGMQGTENGSLVVELQGGRDDFVGYGVTGKEKKMDQGVGCEDGRDFDDEWMSTVMIMNQVLNGFVFNGNEN